MAKMKCDQDLRQKWRSLLREKEGLESLLTLPHKKFTEKKIFYLMYAHHNILN